jgi:hypothetical protein
MPRVLTAPTDLTGCALWLDAMDSVIRDGANLVSQWSDKSGNAKHAVQATPANQPTYSAAGFGGLPCVDWAAAIGATRLVTPNITYGPFTVFIVLRSSSTVGYTYVHEVYSGTPNMDYMTHAAAPHFAVRRSGGLLYRNVVPAQGGAFVADGQRHVVTRVFDGLGSTHNARVDGVLAQNVFFSAAAGNPGVTTSTGPIYLGNADVAVASCRAAFAEFIIFDRALSDGEMVLVEQYLSRKWKIAPRRQIASPLELPDCAMWFDATDLSSITKDGAGLISQWSDKSGNAKHATNATADITKPSYSANGFNGFPCLNWGAGESSARRLTTAAVSLGLFTIVAAVRGNAGALVLCCHNLDGTSGCYMSGGQNWSLRACRTGVYSDKNALTTSWLRDSVNSIIAWRFGGVHGSHTVRTNASTPILIDGLKNDPGTASISGPFYIGNQQTPNVAWRGLIAEMIIYNRALTDGEQTMVEAYLARKYGL